MPDRLPIWKCRHTPAMFECKDDSAREITRVWQMREPPHEAIASIKLLKKPIPLGFNRHDVVAKFLESCFPTLGKRLIPPAHEQLVIGMDSDGERARIATKTMHGGQ